MSINFRTITVLLPKIKSETQKKIDDHLKHVKKHKVIRGFHRQISSRHFAHSLRAFLFFVLIILSGFLLQLLVFLNGKYIESGKEFEARRVESRYWENVAFQFPNVPDVLHNAALSALYIGDSNKALEYIEKAIKIDPLFEKAYLLRREIVEK